VSGLSGWPAFRGVSMEVCFVVCQWRFDLSGNPVCFQFFSSLYPRVCPRKFMLGWLIGRPKTWRAPFFSVSPMLNVAYDSYRTRYGRSTVAQASKRFRFSLCSLLEDIVYNLHRFM